LIGICDRFDIASGGSMQQLNKLFGISMLLASSLLTGCATNSTITSGLKSGDLPPYGAFKAENGIEFVVQPLTLATLPPKKSAAPNASLTQLIRSSGQIDYRITPGDTLSISLSNYITSPSGGDSTSKLVVDQQGLIQFPLIGRIKAAGLTVPQFTANLQRQLQRYLKYSDPQVKIVDYRGNKFFIDGEVKQPGEFSLTDVPVTLYSALSIAGGATSMGDSNNIILNRNGISYSLGLQSLRQMGYSANQIYIKNGDSIHVNSQSRNKVYVLGEFGKVEPVSILEQGLSLSHVLGESSGLNSNTANAAKIYVVRDNPNYPQTNIYYVDMQNLTSFALANRFEMQPNDIVYVDPTGLTRWNRVISALLPSTSAITRLRGF